MTAALLAMAALAPALAPMPLPPVPSPRQLVWHRLEYYAFIHFGPNTFSGVEWGSGREKPESFNPTRLDARQWVRTFKDAGMRGVIITAKHHDGFCLWPSRYSTHTVAQSPWRNGKGDVLREISDACREAGLKLGVYLSPWDRNHPTYGTEEYNDTFVNTLTEVLTKYGPIFEVWFDGANGEGPNGRRQVYDWPRYIATVRKHQPNAVIFSDAGPDVRWVGNERGYAGETLWGMLLRDEFQPGTPRYRELESGHENGTHWVPAEADVSIRPGWFWRESENDKVKTVDQLMDIWYGSVGRGATLLLNVPPDREGRIHPIDVERLLAFRRAREADFRVRIPIRRATAESSRSGFEGGRVADRNLDRYWAAPEGIRSGTLLLDLGRERGFDRISLREPIALGQRVRAFEVDVEKDGGWQTVARATTIGYLRILRLEPVRTARVRVRVLDARGEPLISEIDLFASPKVDKP